MIYDLGIIPEQYQLIPGKGLETERSVPNKQANHKS